MEIRECAERESATWWKREDEKKSEIPQWIVTHKTGLKLECEKQNHGLWRLSVVGTRTGWQAFDVITDVVCEWMSVTQGLLSKSEIWILNSSHAHVRM